MRKRSKLLTGLAVFCAILFGITLTLGLFAYNIEKQLFNPEVYKQALALQNVCQRLPGVITKQIISSATSTEQGGLLGLLIGSMSPEKLQGIIELALPCQVIEKVVYSGIDQVFATINGATGQNGISLDLVKQSIGANSTAALDEFLKSQPDCTAAELLEIGANALLGQGNNKLMFCNPPDALREALMGPLGAMVNAALQGLPDRVQLSAKFVNLLSMLRTARMILNWSPLLPLLFLGLTTAFAVRSWPSLLRWWGIPLLASGLATLVISLVIDPAVYTVLGYLILPRLPVNLVPEAGQFISDVLSTVARGMVRPIQYQSAAISAIGLAMVLYEWLSKPKK